MYSYTLLVRSELNASIPISYPSSSEIGNVDLNLTIPISPESLSPSIYYQYDPVTGVPITPANAKNSNGLILVDRQPTCGRRNKPQRLIRKQSSSISKSLSTSPTPPLHRYSQDLSIGELSEKVSMHAKVYDSHTLQSSPCTNECKNTNWWTITTCIMTLWAPNFILRYTIGDKTTIQAWREKVTLCIIIAIISAAVAYLTLGLQVTICPGSDMTSIPISQVKQLNLGTFIISGEVYDLNKLPGLPHINRPSFSTLSTSDQTLFTQLAGVDVTALFPNNNNIRLYCGSVSQHNFNYTCTTPTYPQIAYCHDVDNWESVKISLKVGHIRYEWNEINGNLLVFNGQVLDLNSYFQRDNRFLGGEVNKLLIKSLGQDASIRLSRNPELMNAGMCLQTLYTVGQVNTYSPGCLASQIILYLSLMIILGVVLTRFFLAVTFDWILSWRLGKLQVSRAAFAQVHQTKKIHRRSMAVLWGRSKIDDTNTNNDKSNNEMTGPVFKGSTISPSYNNMTQDALNDDMILPDNSPIPDELRPYYTVILVTCYSEDEAELKRTLDSVAKTEYPHDQKLIFVVADGIITGKGNIMSTPEVVLRLMKEVKIGPIDPVSYIAIADGSKRHNKARVHVGWYQCDNDNHRTPMVLVIKTGNDDEQGKPKPGNRGKRDGQIILMEFFSKLLLGKPLCPLQFDLFYKIYGFTGVHPLKYEIVLMVDADTILLPDSLPRMVACMAQDSTIMGLCGETRIDNKAQTWVTMIQVFEYYISHHLGKAFESVFGGVTCLPGCFCMYRIKVQRTDNLWVPILSSTVVISSYSENVVDTLHKKNLLSLGEDRYLSTLMLKSFPKRKMLFVPKALCRTRVPHTLSMLLSQRRRWINSTIHNLLELVLVRQLCGTFCFSMQFVVFLELIGTVSLPVAICMTYWLIVQTFLGNVQLIPLFMLVSILGLPAVLIVLTTRQIQYVIWMIIFLISLPVWNFLLPVYSFWHFDDFSWGTTRQVTGENPDHDHSKREGKFDATRIPFLSLTDWFHLIRELEVNQLADLLFSPSKVLTNNSSLQSLSYPYPPPLSIDGKRTDVKSDDGPEI